jgi:putative Holliday junction resolvase
LRLLGVDLGRKRIGLAVGETELAIATPRQTLAASGKLDTDADALTQYAKREEADAVVIGVPIMADAPDGGRMQRVCRELGAKLTARGLNVAYVDESLTSIEAQAALRETGLTAAQRKPRIDGESAARILERYMAEREANG